jgi:hypothetical protein
VRISVLPAEADRDAESKTRIAEKGLYDCNDEGMARDIKYRAKGIIGIKFENWRMLFLVSKRPIVKLSVLIRIAVRIMETASNKKLETLTGLLKIV